jgi:hypothetical protein
MGETLKEKEIESVLDKTDTGKSKSETRKTFEKKVMKSEDKKEEPSTYLSIMQEEEGKLFEMDLIFIRQKGVDEKFLEMTLTVREDVNNQPVAVRKSMEIRTKEEFDRMKEYFVNLSWD